MIDIGKINLCAGCDKAYSKQKPYDYYNFSIGDIKFALCDECLKELYRKIQQILEEPHNET